MRYRGLILLVSCAALLALTPSAAWADNGATLTVPAQVPAAGGAGPQVQPSFTYPEATPFCTVGVDFTWDGVSWLTEFPIKNGGNCIASGINAVAPDGKGTAGNHQVCGSAGAQFKDCKTVAIVGAAGQAPAASAKPAAGGQAPAAQQPTEAPAALATLPPNLPAPKAVTAAVNSLPVESRIAGLVLFGVGVIGLLAILARRLLFRRKRPTPLPTPGRRA